MGHLLLPTWRGIDLAVAVACCLDGGGGGGRGRVVTVVVGPPWECGKMTNQNVVVSDAKSGINMAITVAVSGSSLFSSAAQKPPAVPGTYITISKKKLLQNLDINTGARINAWVDSMRASSPLTSNLLHPTSPMTPTTPGP
ncbi:putative trehalose-phosphate phosphatase J [Sesamum angolense]|uniref:Trehalose-phosphate phosphatase J n=1 Tax=Sesamum angolense TaxID=2727404 RepID=A0AAE1XHR7_9LAMI|nr:putative trehalose-phosphate phosphatase J [Sesamum angolense]